MGVVKGAISIRDNMSAVLRSVRQEQTAFRRDVERTRRELQTTWDRRRTARLDATAANRAAQRLRQRLEPLRKKIVTAIAIKDMASAKVKAVANKVKAVGKIIASPLVKLKDGVTAGLSKIKGNLKSIAKKVVIPITVAATVATAALGGAVKSGMQLENQQVSIKHYIGATNKGMDEAGVQKVADEFLAQLRENANATPFETGDVIAAGSRAVAVANGDTKQAMQLVKLAEDMAAASGGTKSIGDALEALADAKMGETERLKEFGFKVSAEEFEQKGFEGVSNDLQGFFGGAAEKLAQTGSGLMSTIKGKLKSNVADFGLKVVEKMKPALSSIITLIDKVSPVIEKFGVGIAEKIGSGIEAASAFIPQLISGFQSVQPILSGFINGFRPLLPQLASFGTSVMGTIQQVTTAVMPAIGSIINTVQAVLPSVLPVIETVVNTIGSVISAAAPVIAGLVEGIGQVVSTLAPVFQTIFDGIGQKVGSVLEFVGSKMGWIQEIIGTVAPVVAEILTTAWSVISPVLDIAISVFKVLFNVVQTVFNGIASVISSVWETIKPIVDGIANGLSWIADKIGGLFGFGGGGGGSVGSNAEGTNNWRGGPTWVGERGPELVDLPRGSRVLPNKESVQVARSAAQPVVREIVQHTVEKPVVYAAGGNSTPALESIGKHLGVISNLLAQGNRQGQGVNFPAAAHQRPDNGPEILPVPEPARQTERAAAAAQAIQVTIAKLADQIIVREDADIDRIGEAVAKRVVLAAQNMVPA